MKIEGDGGDGRRRRGERTRATTIKNKGRKRQRMRMEERMMKRESEGRENDMGGGLTGCPSHIVAQFKRRTSAISVLYLAPDPCLPP
jgi:hypothetical protein